MKNASGMSPKERGGGKEGAMLHSCTFDLQYPYTKVDTVVTSIMNSLFCLGCLHSLLRVKGLLLLGQCHAIQKEPFAAADPLSFCSPECSLQGFLHCFCRFPDAPI
eukprot:gb/GECG01002184.1/.p1 GENE.gb/GECG01002184.1/~~gb/GECG01002184.1/.p1  ORF type:complete len:106 (+),score=10.44 gb/GECG01002184.1/:1-318(+)